MKTSGAAKAIAARIGFRVSIITALAHEVGVAGLPNGGYGSDDDRAFHMCGRMIQSSSPLRLAIVEGLEVSNSRMANISPRYNAATCWAAQQSVCFTPESRYYARPK